MVNQFIEGLGEFMEIFLETVGNPNLTLWILLMLFSPIIVLIDWKKNER